MNPRENGLWTIDELSTRVAKALEIAYAGAPNGRIRDVPDRRTIRYYTTLGLIDRPAEMQGRTAFYSRRHLMQVVAIKRLQARGMSLVEVQSSLLGMTAAALQEIAALPAGLDDSPMSEMAPPKVLPRARSAAFWKEEPTDAIGEAEITQPSSLPQVGQSRGPVNPPTVFQGVRLGEEITLLFSPLRAISEDDLEAIQAAAGPLLTTLRRRGLLQGRPGENP